MALLKRLETDQSLAAFAGQFVPLKLTTDGNPEWSQWARKYSFDGNGIPILFVIRADGEKLYAKSGSLPGAQLPQMLLAALSQAGRRFNDAEAQLLAQAVEQAQAALKDDDQLQAARALGQLKKIGTPGELQSFSTLAQEADQMVGQVQQAAQQKIEQSAAAVDGGQASLEDMLYLVEAEDSCAGFAELRAPIAQALRKARRDEELKETVSQAEALVRARQLAAAESGAVRRRASAAYERIIRRYAGTPAEAIARHELAEIDPDSKVLAESDPGDPGSEPADKKGEYRVWTDSTGRFQTTARLIAVQNGKVALQGKDGRTIVLALEQLSEEDRQFLQRQ